MNIHQDIKKIFWIGPPQWTNNINILWYVEFWKIDMNIYEFTHRAWKMSHAVKNDSQHRRPF